MRLENFPSPRPASCEGIFGSDDSAGLGAVFIQSGFANITHHAMTTAFFVNLGFAPTPSVVSVTIPWIEFICGIALVGGMLSRVAAFLLFADMTVAIVVANPEVAADIFKLLRFCDFRYMLLLTGLISHGLAGIRLEA